MTGPRTSLKMLGGVFAGLLIVVVRKMSSVTEIDKLKGGGDVRGAIGC